MFDHLKNLLLPKTEKKPQLFEKEERLQTATCVLFIEIAGADGNITSDEKLLITNIIKNKFNLNDKSIKELLHYAELKIEASSDLYQFTTLINSSFSREEKFGLMINLWQLVYNDNKLDKYEDYLIKKIGGLLNLDHKEIIDAKLIVKEKIKKDNL